MAHRIRAWFVLAIVVALPRLALAQHDPAHNPPKASAKSEASPHGTASGSAHEAVAAPAPAIPAAKTTTKRSTGSAAKGGDASLGTAITRIQERIAAETGASKASPSKPRGAAAPTTAPAAAPLRQHAPRTVTLRWRAALQWPAELDPHRLLPPSDPVELIWQ